MEPPILQISSFEEITDEMEKPPILNVLAQRCSQDGMIQTGEALSAVALNEPDHPNPGLLSLSQGCVASTFRSEPMRLWAETGFVVCL